MDKSQKKFSNRTNFEFGDDLLKYTLKDSSGSRTFSIEYGAISTDSGELEERNAWYRNVGFLWILIGAIVIYTHFADTGEVRGSLWFTLGLICIAMYWILKTSYTILDTEKGRIFIIKDAAHDEILDTIDARRKKQWFEWYGTIDYGNDPSKEVGKFQWLLDRDAISEDVFLESKRRIIEYHNLDEVDDTSDDRTLN